MLLSYVHHYIKKHLGMDPHTVVQVQGKQPSKYSQNKFNKRIQSDLGGLAHGKQPDHCPMTIGEAGLELLKGADAKCLNALSMASSGIHNASEIHMYVTTDRSVG